MNPGATNSGTLTSLGDVNVPEFGFVSIGPGNLTWRTAKPTDDALASAVRSGLAALEGRPVEVANIDPDLADTAAFCERYGVLPSESANCVIVTGRREGAARYAACLVLASERLDVNGAVRRRLDVRKASFAPMDEAVALTGMEYGGITPIGVPTGWPILVTAAVAEAGVVVIGSGVRRSKIAMAASDLFALPGAELL